MLIPNLFANWRPHPRFLSLKVALKPDKRSDTTFRMTSKWRSPVSAAFDGAPNSATPSKCRPGARFDATNSWRVVGAVSALITLFWVGRFCVQLVQFLGGTRCA